MERGFFYQEYYIESRLVHDMMLLEMQILMVPKLETSASNQEIYLFNILNTYVMCMRCVCEVYVMCM